MPVYCWHRFISLTLQLATVALYASINIIPADASPLLEKEQCTVSPVHSIFVAIVLYVFNN